MPEQLDQVLASLRLTESGSLKGNYGHRGKAVNGDVPLGAYGILESNWSKWTEYAGIKGAPWQDPQAQDLVASTIMNYYMERFGDYELASVAWFAGPDQAGQILRRGWADAESSIQNPVIKDYVKRTGAALKQAQDPTNAKYLKKISPRQFTTTKGGGSWINPVAGKSEWSGGSWMPNTLNHRGRTHAAIDVYADEGTPIVSPVGGKVLSVKTGDIGGHTVRVLGDDGMEYYFAHMAAESVAKVGEQINPGFHLGYVGNSGSARTTKHHLHFSMKEGGNPVSPISYLNNATVNGVGKGYSASDTSDGVSAGMRNNLSAWAQKLSDKTAGGQRKPLPPLDPQRGTLEESTTEAGPY